MNEHDEWVLDRDEERYFEKHGRFPGGPRMERRMAYEQKDMSGSLFKNDRKESDSHPDYKGSALLNGVEHWLDAWINTAKDGSKYMSLKFKPKEARQTGSYGRQEPAPAFDDDSDSVPF